MFVSKAIQMWTKRISLFLILASALSAQTTSGWQLVWSDEFNGAAGSPPDPTKWNYDLGRRRLGQRRGGNLHQLPARTRIRMGNGNLVIRAIRSSSGRLYLGASPNRSSRSLQPGTADNSWQYGIVVARIKLPFGQGVWPAFWMLGENIGSVGWPACGETDVMESFGTFNNKSISTTVTCTDRLPPAAPQPIENAGSKSTLTFGGSRSMTGYHVYAIQWSMNSVTFYLDGRVLHGHALIPSPPAGSGSSTTRFSSS